MAAPIRSAQPWKLGVGLDPGNTRSSYLLLRNVVCSALAVALIAVGRVRRARGVAFADGVITAIYFHNPSKTLFSKCIRWLVRHEYVFVSADDVLGFLQGRSIPRGAVWISFDDGFRDMIGNVLPEIRKYNVPITVFLPSGVLQGNGVFPWLDADTGGQDGTSDGRASVRHCLTISELKRMRKCASVIVGAHTVHHVITAGCDDDQMRFELGQCKRALEAVTGGPVQYFAYPNGRFDGRERRWLEEFRYSLAATTENAFTTRETEPYLVPRFSVADSIWLPEAICNMTGVWKPAIDRIKRIIGRA
jgi:peptidoglycan/xylan/chitin deacetylase (PgdA/CDA1 family)